MVVGQMLSFGENGWIKYGWSEQLNREKSAEDNFYIKLIPNVEISPSELAINTAIKCVKKISQNYPPPYNLMCSGGTDSQAMIYAWLKSDIPFNIVSIRYISDNVFWNQADLLTLEQFAETNQLTVDFKDFDVIDFLENQLDYVSNTYECPSPQISTHIKMTDLISHGTIIFSGNYIQRKKSAGLSPALLGLHKFSLFKHRKEISILPFFFLEFPELAYAFTDTDSITKDEGYIKHGFPVIKQSEKMTGFEELKDFYDKYQDRVTAIDRLKFFHKPSKRVFDLVFRYPYEESKNYQVIQLTYRK